MISLNHQAGWENVALQQWPDEGVKMKGNCFLGRGVTLQIMNHFLAIATTSRAIATTFQLISTTS